MKVSSMDLNNVSLQETVVKVGVISTTSALRGELIWVRMILIYLGYSETSVTTNESS